MDKRRITSCLLSAAGSFAAVGLMLGGWLFSLRELCAIPVEDLSLLGWCFLISLAAAALTCLPSKPRWGIIGCLAGGAALALWRWDSLLPALREIFLRIVTPLSDLFPALHLSQTDSTVLLSLSHLLFLAAVMALLLSFFTAAQCWWAAMAVCYLPFLPAVMAGTMPSWYGFLAMTAGGLTLLFTALYRPEEPRSMGRSRLLSLAMSLVLLLTLTVALPQDTYEYPQWARDARENLMEVISHGIEGAGDWQFPTGTPSGEGSDPDVDVGMVSPSTGEVDLTAVGPRRFTGRTMLTVEGSHEGRTYLRGSSSALYTGTSWEPLSDETYQELADADIAIEGAQSFLYPQLYTTGETASLTIRHVSVSDTLAYMPYQPTADTIWNALTPKQDAYLTPPAGQSSYTLSYFPSFVPQEDLTPDASEEYTYRPFVYSHYLDVPEETARLLSPLSSRLSGIAVQLPEDLADSYRYPVTTALQVAHLLGQLAVYDLNTPAMEEGDDFVAHFLEEGRGYCVHFATTATLLLRMNGIPARYVSGYTANVVPGETTYVPDYAAHAWVEIYLDGYGWYPVEVTPGGGETSDELPDTEESLLPDDTTPDDQPQTEEPAVPTQPWENDPTADESTNSSEPAAEPLDLRWLIVPTAVLLLAGLLWGLERLAAYRRRQEEQRPDTNTSVLAAYRRCRRLVALGAAEDTILEDLARKAKFSQHTLTEEERQLCWKQLHQAAAESLSHLPWWKGIAVRLLDRY